MTEKDSKYEAGFASDAKKNPVRVVFITKKTSAKVTGDAGPQVMAYPHLLMREAIVFMVLVIALVSVGAVLGRASRATCQSASDAESSEGSLVFPGLAGVAALFPSAGRRDHHPDAGCDRLDRHPLLQRQRAGAAALARQSEAHTIGSFWPR